MALAVSAQHLTVSIDDSQRVVPGIVFLLIKTDGQHNAELFCNRPEMSDCPVLLQFRCQAVIIRFLFLTEIRRLKKLLQKYDIGTSAGCLTHQHICFGYVLICIAGTAHLRCCNNYLSQRITSVHF
jgi:hypothetical protein